ncbi:MAG: Smr/MutS family protein [Alphaproteobacteria bacterium]|nr:Smr/MutS family protein [Alphaproteobacteria bacterium]
MKKKLTPEDLHLWQSQLKGVKPLEKKVSTLENTSPPKKLKPPQPLKRSLEIKSHAAIPSAPLQDFARKELRHLKIDGRLDLHGMTINEGFEALERFLLRAQEKSFRTVLIITGKGAVSSENTLRRQLPRWIKETPLRHLVSGFHSPAKQQDGGQGACYLSVRKRS